MFDDESINTRLIADIPIGTTRQRSLIKKLFMLIQAIKLAFKSQSELSPLGILCCIWNILIISALFMIVALYEGRSEAL